MNIASRIGFVVTAALLSGLPGAIAGSPGAQGPVSYVASALGVGGIGLMLGLMVLLIAHGKKNGGLGAAVLITVAVGLFSSWSVFYGVIRG
jgi:hypothetical protein